MKEAQEPAIKYVRIELAYQGSTEWKGSMETKVAVIWKEVRELVLQ